MLDNDRKGLDFKKVILPTIYEYLLILLPVSIYVGIDSIDKNFVHFVSSPEWAIASIFLSFQGTALYFRHLSESNRKVNFDFLGILLLGVIAITITASLNAYASLNEHTNTDWKITLRLILLMLSSIAFFVLVIASKAEN